MDLGIIYVKVSYYTKPQKVFHFCGSNCWPGGRGYTRTFSNGLNPLSKKNNDNPFSFCWFRLILEDPVTIVHIDKLTLMGAIYREEYMQLVNINK